MNTAAAGIVGAQQQATAPAVGGSGARPSVRAASAWENSSGFPLLSKSASVLAWDVILVARCRMFSMAAQESHVRRVLCAHPVHVGLDNRVVLVP